MGDKQDADGLLMMPRPGSFSCPNSGIEFHKYLLREQHIVFQVKDARLEDIHPDLTSSILP